ncbi:MAG: helix-turn-helix transcriptional regulator [Bacteroidales bacterium]|nr:helix-turn-helix transcriptional regulator [Bacteroidales bacterium]
MNSTIERLNAHKSSSPSRWKEEAQFRVENKGWLRYSQKIAMRVLDEMETKGFTQKEFAEKVGCSQQYISRILKGRENLSLETIAKLEAALEATIIEIKL